MPTGGVDLNTASAFLKAWELGNREACGTYRGDSATDPPTMVRSRLLSVWRWNYERSELQRNEGEAVFVPRVWFVRVGSTVATAVIWPETRGRISTALLASKRPTYSSHSACGTPSAPSDSHADSAAPVPAASSRAASAERSRSQRSG